MLSVTDLVVRRGGRDLFSPITFAIDPKQITVIMGSSGIGKTSILDAIRGLIPYSGNIQTQEHFSVFQDTNQLFPWYTVQKNLELVCKTDFNNTVVKWKIDNLLNKKPNQISGGQKQRFTLIRALHSSRQVLLCDEAVSALDALTKYSVLVDFKRSIIEKNLACLWMTHDLREAKLIGDNILLLTKHGLELLPKNIAEDSLIEKLEK